MSERCLVVFHSPGPAWEPGLPLVQRTDFVAVQWGKLLLNLNNALNALSGLPLREQVGRLVGADQQPDRMSPVELCLDSPAHVRVGTEVGQAAAGMAGCDVTSTAGARTVTSSAAVETTSSGSRSVGGKVRNTPTTRRLTLRARSSSSG